MSESKQFEASQKHINKARRKGQVLKSPNLSKALSLLVVFIGLNISLTFSWVAPELLLKSYMASDFTQVIAYLKEVGWSSLGLLSVTLGLAWVVSTAVDVFLVGFLFQPNLLALDLNRLNPVSGFKNLFKGWKDLPLRLVLLASLVVVFCFFVDRFLSAFLIELSEPEALAILTSSMKLCALALMAILLCYGVADYGVQYRRYYKELMMTLKEVRDEHKESEGDPYMKALRKDLHEQILLQELVERVKSSKFIVVEKMSEGV